LVIKNRTEITIETERLVVTRRSRRLRVWCRLCARQTIWVTVDEAAIIAHASSRTVYRWVEDEKIHFNETSELGLLICFDSIPAPELRSQD
jgi:hypothetical protein